MARANDSSADGQLQWTSFPAGEAGFFRAPTLLFGPSEALLIDGGFTLADGRAVAEAISATGRKLTCIYVSQSDPDYYFSLRPITERFPGAPVIAATDTIAAIKSSVEKKLSIWGPQLGDNGPKTLTDVVIPTAYDGGELLVDGNPIHVMAARNLANRRYLWAPSIAAIFGGVLVFSGVHVWTADTTSAEERSAWINELEAMLERRPAVVVPGHMTPIAPTGPEAIVYTRDYLRAFEQELTKAADGAELIAAMTRRYPDAGMSVALQIGAKVATGEMNWG